MENLKLIFYEKMFVSFCLIVNRRRLRCTEKKKDFPTHHHTEFSYQEYCLHWNQGNVFTCRCKERRSFCTTIIIPENGQTITRRLWHKRSRFSSKCGLGRGDWTIRQDLVKTLNQLLSITYVTSFVFFAWD